MSFYCTVWKIEKFTVTQKKNSSNQLFSIFFSKYVTFTKFLSKKCDSKFLQFPHCVSLEKIFLKLIYIVPRHGLLVKKLISRNFSKKSGKENFRNLHNCAQHTVEITEFYFHGLSQKFRQINDLLKNFTIN